MTPAVARHLNGLTTEAARTALARCCGAERWVEEMLAARPFASDAALYETAERVWWELEPADWRAAFAHHPRIGARDPGDAWARSEQAGVAGAGAHARRDLARSNRAYEERFGHVFLICATGRTAAEMLGELRRRLAHDAATELRVAAAEQAKITRLRLEKLVTP